MRQIDQNAAENVNRVLVGNKADVTSAERVEFLFSSLLCLQYIDLLVHLQKVSYEQGKALADEFGIKFFETSAKQNINVEAAFKTIATDIVESLKKNPDFYGAENGAGVKVNTKGAAAEKSSCC